MNISYEVSIRGVVHRFARYCMDLGAYRVSQPRDLFGLQVCHRRFCFFGRFKYTRCFTHAIAHIARNVLLCITLLTIPPGTVVRFVSKRQKWAYGVSKEEGTSLGSRCATDDFVFLGASNILGALRMQSHTLHGTCYFASPYSRFPRAQWFVLSASVRNGLTGSLKKRWGPL